jgi:hypothetical protein
MPKSAGGGFVRFGKMENLEHPVILSKCQNLCFICVYLWPEYAFRCKSLHRNLGKPYSPFEENWSSLFLNNRLKVVSEP